MKKSNSVEFFPSQFYVMSVPQKITCLANNHLYSSAALFSSLTFILESQFPLALTSSFLHYFIQPIPFWIHVHSNWCGPSLRRLLVWWYMASDNLHVFSYAELKAIHGLAQLIKRGGEGTDYFAKAYGKFSVSVQVTLNGFLLKSCIGKVSS